MHVGAKNKAMRSKELPAELRDRTVSRHGAGEKLQKKKSSAALKVTESEAASVIIKFRNFGATTTLPRAN